MLSRIRSAAVLGIDAYPVEVEVDLAPGLPSFTTVGLPHGAVKEGRERVAAAIVNSGFEVPLKRIIANLAPADVPKAGSAFDLPIAVGILAASGQIKPIDLAGGLCFGELGLEGDLRPLRGTLSLVSCAKQVGAEWIVLPEPNQREGALVDGVRILGARTLRDVVAHLEGRSEPIPRSDEPQSVVTRPVDEADFAEVRGQRAAKRALEVAAAGATTSSWLARQVAGRRCWPAACRVCFPRSMLRRPWKSPRSTAWRACCRLGAASLRRVPFALLITLSVMPACQAVASILDLVR